MTHPDIASWLNETLASSSDDRSFRPRVPGKWHDWFCVGDEDCKVGDFNGDGFVDIAAVSQGERPFAWVALSAGQIPLRSGGSGRWGFELGAPSIWSEALCSAGGTCEAADLDGDGRDDLVELRPDGVRFARSEGTSFGPAEHAPDVRCTAGACRLGDVDGDGRVDVLRSVAGEVALPGTSTRVRISRLSVYRFQDGRFEAPVTWDHLQGCGPDCMIADVDGDALADRVTYRSSRRELWFSRSSGTALEAPKLALAGVTCDASHTCTLADVNGDGAADAIVFDRLANSAMVALSRGETFGPIEVWHSSICGPDVVCRVGDFTGDGKSDVAAFVRSTSAAREGDVYVVWSFAAGRPR